MDKKMKRTIVMLVCIVGLVFFSMVFMVLNIPLPFLPSFVELQFSAVLELFGAIAYGPFVGIFIVLAKEFFYYWLTGCAFVELVSNIIADVVFVVISSCMYVNIRGGVIKKVDKKGNKHEKIVTRRKRIMISGGVATIASVVITAIFARFVDPVLFVKYTDLTNETMLQAYKNIAGIGSLSTGVLLVNVPIALLEYGIATIFVALLYKKVSGFMHGKFVS